MSPAAAERVRLVSGATLTAIDFQLLGVSPVRVQGRFVNPETSDLVTGSVVMSPESNEGLGTAQAALVRPNSSFEFVNVPPGAYRLRASARTQRGPALFASFYLEAQDNDIVNAVMYLSRGAELLGQIEVSGGATLPPPGLANLWVGAPMADGSTGSGLTRSRALENGSFSLATLEGNRVVRLEGLPDPWSLETVLYRGSNVIDVPFDLRAGQEREQISPVLTDRATRLVGVTQDDAGNAMVDRAVVALPVNSSFWLPGSRHIRLTYPDSSGRYEIVWLPAGAYLIAAVPGINNGDLYDAAIFQEIAAAGTEVLLEPGTTTTLNLILNRGESRLAN